MQIPAVLALATCLYAASAAQAFGGPLEDEPGEMMPPANDSPHFFHWLNLSDDQQQRIDEIHHKYAAKMHDLMQQLQTARSALGNLVTEHASEADAASQHKKVSELMTQLGDQRFQMMYEMAGVLTPEQRAKMREKQSERLQHHHPHRPHD